MKICVVGAGYVGLTLSAALASIGHDMICTDKDVKKIGQLKKESFPFMSLGFQMQYFVAAISRFLLK